MRVVDILNEEFFRTGRNIAVSLRSEDIPSVLSKLFQKLLGAIVKEGRPITLPPVHPRPTAAVEIRDSCFAMKAGLQHNLKHAPHKRVDSRSQEKSQSKICNDLRLVLIRVFKVLRFYKIVSVRIAP